jgi:hypothetical protein
MNTDTLIDLQGEIELTKERFHRLPIFIPEDALRLPSKGVAWTNGEVLYRMALAPLLIRSILKRNFGKKARASLAKLVTGTLIDWGNERRIHSAVRNLTLLSLAKDYEYNCALLLEIVEQLSDDDLVKTVTVIESNALLPRQSTVTELLHYVKNHFNLCRRQLGIPK